MFARCIRLVCLLVLPSLAFAQDVGRGAMIYAEICTACHQAEGEGAVGIAPALAGTLAKRAAQAEGIEHLAQILVSGMSGPIVSKGQKFNGSMPAFAALNNEDLAAVMNFVLQKFNNNAGNITPEALVAARAKKMRPGDVRKQREKVLAASGE